MSQTKQYHIRCPKCEAEQNVELYDSVNIETDAGLRDELMANRLNAVVCSGTARC